MNAVDQLGAIQAQIAELRELEAALKGEILDSGESVVEGDLFQATVVTSERKTTNWKSIAVKLGASVQMIRGNTKVQEVVSIRVRARSTETRKAA